jgi:hypothetical protein
MTTLSSKKEKRRSSISKNQMFRSMIAQAETNQVKFDYILSDNWFGAKKNMEFIHYDMKPTKVVRSQKNHIFASIIAYCKLEFLRT